MPHIYNTLVLCILALLLVLHPISVSAAPHSPSRYLARRVHSPSFDPTRSGLGSRPPKPLVISSAGTPKSVLKHYKRLLGVNVGLGPAVSAKLGVSLIYIVLRT